MIRAWTYASALALLPLGAAASDVTMVIERGPTTVEVFLGMPAEGLVDYFGLPPERLEDETGEVAFEPLRLGTWTIGDDVFAGVEARIGGAPASYEAMSLMVHPEDQKLPLYNSFDGMMAIAVCSVEPPENPTLDRLYSYVGYIAYPGDPNGALQFTLPETGRDALRFEIRDFREGALLAETQVTVPDGGTLALAPAPPKRWFEDRLDTLALSLFVALATIGFGAYAALRQRPDWFRAAGARS
jgi:hypothetical protein